MNNITKKVLLVAPLPPPVGGIASWAISMSQCEFLDGWKLENFRTNFEQNEVYGHINVSRNWGYEIKRCLKIWIGIINRLSEDKEIKIVHVNIPANLTSMTRECVTAVITKCMHRKTVVHFHCTVPQIVQKKMQFMVFKLLCRLSGNIIVLNKASREFVEKNTKSKCFLVPNFVNNNLIRQKDKKINDRVKCALFVGGVIDKKGCRTIIEVAKTFPEVQFRMVGHISEEYKTIDLPSNVKLLGTKTGEALRKEYEEADVFLFLSYMLNEGFSIALTEAMAYGLPCIATDWAANKDMLGDDGGIIVPIKSPEKVREALLQIDNVKFREKASKRNVDTVRKYYSQDVIPCKLSKVYTDILRN